MTELKTLKDIAQPFDMTAELLQQEAIKWVKKFSYKVKTPTGEYEFSNVSTVFK